MADEERSLKQLKLQYEMYERTKKETEKKLKTATNPDGTKKYKKEDIDEELALINKAEQDIIDQYLYYGGKIEDLKKKKKTSATTLSSNDEITKAALELLSENQEVKKAINAAKSETETRLEQEYIPKKGEYDTGANFDLIKLPSNGEGYKDKISRVAVSYLTAYDENMIVSPHLYRDNLILDMLLNEKLMSKEIDPLDLLEGDRDAIILFLRMNGYGNEYPITATDDATGKEFDTVVDLSKLKFKDFTLKGDSNGWFPFTLPESGVEVKFRFPTHRDTLILDKLRKAEDAKLMKADIKEYVENMDTYIENNKTMPAEEKVKIRQAIRTIESWGEDMEETDLKFNLILTNRLNLLIMAVDGITDRQYISDFIRKMRAKDSSALRKYIAKNEPGIDYTITVNRPENLGGGSFETFLQLDQFLFLNIAE